MADDKLVSKFLEALAENGQQQVVRILVPEGLNMSALCYIYFISLVAICETTEPGTFFIID